MISSSALKQAHSALEVFRILSTQEGVAAALDQLVQERTRLDEKETDLGLREATLAEQRRRHSEDMAELEKTRRQAAAASTKADEDTAAAVTKLNEVALATEKLKSAEKKLGEREQVLRASEGGVSTRKQELDARENALDARAAELDNREAAVQMREDRLREALA